MELSFSEKQLCKVLESYYKEQEDINGKVTISVTDGYTGYGIAESDIKVPYFEGVTVITKNKTKKIGGM